MKIGILLDKLAKPAATALGALGLSRVEELAKFGEEDLASLHGIGPRALSQIRAELESLGKGLKASPKALKASPKARARPRTSADPVGDYIAAQPPPARAALERMRETIRRAAPEATERLSYSMPAFELQGILVYYAAFTKHIGFFPTSSGVARFEDRLGAFKHAKGSVQFPLDREIPYDLVEEIVRFRVGENKAKAAGRAGAGKSRR